MFHIESLPQTLHNSLQNAGAHNIHIDNYFEGENIAGRFAVNNVHFFDNERLKFVVSPVRGEAMDQRVSLSIYNDNDVEVYHVNRIDPQSVSNHLTEYINNPQLAVLEDHDESFDNDKAYQNLNTTIINKNQSI